jgi:hypothetical protein
MRIPIALFAAALFSGLFQTNANASAINQDAQRDTLYATVTVPLIDDTLTSHILTQVKKGTALSVIDINAEKNSGVRFLVNDGKNEGWIFGKYLTPSKEEAEKVHDFMMEKHRAVRNPYKGGLATDCDFSPYEKPHFPDNEMPNPCNALYLNISPSGLKKIDDFIALADSTLINAFVIDIKDNEAPGFKAEAMKKFSPTAIHVPVQPRRNFTAKQWKNSTPRVIT